MRKAKEGKDPRVGTHDFNFFSIVMLHAEQDSLLLLFIISSTAKCLLLMRIRLIKVFWSSVHQWI